MSPCTVLGPNPLRRFLPGFVVVVPTESRIRSPKARFCFSVQHPCVDLRNLKRLGIIRFRLLTQLFLQGGSVFSAMVCSAC